SLSMVDAGHRPLPGRATAHANLDDRDHAPIARDDVDLEAPDVNVDVEHLEAARDEVVGDGLLGALAGRRPLGVCDYWVPDPTPWHLSSALKKPATLPQVLVPAV